MRYNFLLPFVFSIFLTSCSNLKKTNTNNLNPELKLLNTIEIPFEKTYQNTKIGGLSGIDYDKKNDLYYLISDDRSNPRFYKAKISLIKNELKSIDFTAITILKNEFGKNYSDFKLDPKGSVDPEDIRYNPQKNTIIWSNEGARILTKEQTVLENPSINFIDLKGNFISRIILPENLVMQKIEKGPRNNGVLEGITFDKHYKNIFSTVEEPLFEDGIQSNTTKGGLVRLFQFDVSNKKNTAQYGYQLEPVAHEPKPKDAFSINGISAIQYYKKNQLFVVERSFSTGTHSCTIKVFLCDFKNATNVKNIHSIENTNLKLISKKLILNMDDLDIYIDNIEGITFGPKLENGHHSLIFISDNNFSKKEKTQLLLFELLEK